GVWLTMPSGSAATLSEYLDNGVILSVNSAVWCDPENDPEARDYFGTTVMNSDARDFIVNTLGNAAHFDDSGTWARTCWDNWCHYDAIQKAALIAVAVL